MNQLYLSNNMSRMVRKGVAIDDAVRYRKCKSDRNGWITFLAFFGYLVLRLIVELTHRLTKRDDEIKALIKKVALLKNDEIKAVIKKLTHLLTKRDDEIKALLKKVAALEKKSGGEAAASKSGDENKKVK